MMPGTNVVENQRRLQELLHQRGGYLVLEGLRPSRQSFAYEAYSGVEVCLAVVAGGQAVAVLVSADLEYREADPALQQLFRSGPVDRGWRPVARLQTPTAAAVLRHLDALLGLDGQPPRLAEPWAREREIVVPLEREVHHRADERHDGARFGGDLVERARRGGLGDVVGREQEVESLVRIVSKLTKNAACLVGPPGVGKTAVVEKLAMRVASEHVPPTLRDARIIEVNLGFLAAGASHRNEFEGRFKDLLDAARGDPHTILFFDEAHVLCSGMNDASQLVKQDLGRGRIRCIGATTNREWGAIEADAALARRFQVIPVAEPTPKETVQILTRLRDRIAQHHGVNVPGELLPEVVDLAVRYVSDRRLPDKAIDLLDEAAAREAMRRDQLPASPQAEGSGGGQAKTPGRPTTLPEDLNAAIDAAIARGDYARAYELDARRGQGDIS